MNVKFVNFSAGRKGSDDIDSSKDRTLMEAKSWWLVHSAHAPTFQKIAP